MNESYGISIDERLTPSQLASVLDTPLPTIVDWRRKGKGPPYIKIVGRIYYPKVALEEWLKENMHL